jgi:hypothetical protein
MPLRDFTARYCAFAFRTRPDCAFARLCCAQHRCTLPLHNSTARDIAFAFRTRPDCAFAALHFAFALHDWTGDCLCYATPDCTLPKRCPAILNGAALSFYFAWLLKL